MGISLGAGLENFATLMEEIEKTENTTVYNENTDSTDEIEQLRETKESEDEFDEVNDQVEMCYFAISSLHKDLTETQHLKQVIKNYGLSESLYQFINKGNSFKNRCKRMNMTVASLESFVEGNRSQQMEVVASLENMFTTIKNTIMNWLKRLGELIGKWWAKFKEMISNKKQAISNFVQKIKDKAIPSPTFNWVECGIDSQKKFVNKTKLNEALKNYSTFLKSEFSEQLLKAISFFEKTIQNNGENENELDTNLIEKFSNKQNTQLDPSKLFSKDDFVNTEAAGKMYSVKDSVDIANAFMELSNNLDRLDGITKRLQSLQPKIESIVKSANEENKNKLQFILDNLKAIIKIVGSVLTCVKVISARCEQIIGAIDTCINKTNSKNNKNENN